MGKKFEAFKEKLSDGVAKVVAFTRRHPVLTVVASNIAVAAVSGGIAYAKTKSDGVTEADGMVDETRYSNHEKHAFMTREGSLYSEELNKSLEAQVKSEKINNIVKGIEGMNLRVGDAVYTVKTDEDKYVDVLISNRDESMHILNQFRDDVI